MPGVVHIRMLQSTEDALKRVAKKEQRSFSAQCAVSLQDWVDGKGYTKPEKANVQ